MMGDRMSASKFINLLVKCMVPPEDYAEIYQDEFQKRNIVKEILLKAVATFTIYVVNEAMDEILSLSIRNNKNPQKLQEANLKLKEKFKSILHQKKNEFCALLVAHRNGVDIMNPESRAMIPEEIVFRLEDKIRTLVEEKSTIIREKNDLIRSQNKLIGQMRELLARCRELETEVASLARQKTASTSGAPSAAGASAAVDTAGLSAPAVPSVQDVPDDSVPEAPVVNLPPPEFTNGADTSGDVDANSGDSIDSDESAFEQSAEEPVLESVEDLKNAKYTGIQLAPKPVQAMHNVEDLDEIDVSEESYESELDEDELDVDDFDDESDMSVDDD